MPVYDINLYIMLDKIIHFSIKNKIIIGLIYTGPDTMGGLLGNAIAH